jgi:hypothetical protein
MVMIKIWIGRVVLAGVLLSLASVGGWGLGVKTGMECLNSLYDIWLLVLMCCICSEDS